jgi:aspartate racemase
VKTIGVIGGMSWESTATYYQRLNEGVKDRLGGLHSARVVLHSVDFAGIEAMQRAGQWEEAGQVLHEAARGLVAAGAELLLIAANTMHKVADQVVAGLPVPLVHIADATAAAVKAGGHRAIGLLGTRYTMEQDFLRGRFEARHGLSVLVPGAEDRAEVNRIIFEELCLGRVVPASRARFAGVAAGLVAAGAQAIVAGCTEFHLIFSQADCAVPVFDTLELHVAAALDAALGPRGVP